MTSSILHRRNIYDVIVSFHTAAEEMERNENSSFSCQETISKKFAASWQRSQLSRIAEKNERTTGTSEKDQKGLKGQQAEKPNYAVETAQVQRPP